MPLSKHLDMQMCGQLKVKSSKPGKKENTSLGPNNRCTVELLSPWGGARNLSQDLGYSVVIFPPAYVHYCGWKQIKDLSPALHPRLCTQHSQEDWLRSDMWEWGRTGDPQPVLHLVRAKRMGISWKPAGILVPY